MKCDICGQEIQDNKVTELHITTWGNHGRIRERMRSISLQKVCTICADKFENLIER